ncbi:MAG TPA: transporter substrate-binding domain-containing protein [Acetobacteraceae bacterium]
MFDRRGLAGAVAAAMGVLALAPRRAAAQSAAPAPGESTMDRVRRTRKLRISVLPGEAPFFIKDPLSGAWSGAAIDMAHSIASAIDAELVFVEATYASSVLDLETNKSDLAFALNPTPQRALAIGFTLPYFQHPFGYVSRPGFPAKTWADLNDPKIRAVSLIGSLTDVLLERYAPKAQRVEVKGGADGILMLQAGRADCIVYALIQALSVTAREPAFSQVTLLRQPFIALPSAMGIQEEPDRRWRDFLNSWTEYNVGTRRLNAWIRAALLKMGISPSAIPADSDL